MPMTLLFSESPIIGTAIVFATLTTIHYNYQILASILLVLLVFLLFFYRYYECTKRFSNDTVVCPADGTITKLIITPETCFISIFLSPMNIHTQLYPVNATVLSHVYDHTGKFDIVTDADKSRDNEKAIHQFQMINKAIITLTQIAGFLPRRITYNPQINHQVSAGEYLGMIKFGSRVDINIPRLSPTGKKFNITDTIKLNNTITIGDVIGQYDV